MNAKSPLPGFVEMVAGGLREEPLFLIDIGARGGINKMWRRFGESLRAIGFDPDIRECQRLNDAEGSRGALYVPSFVTAAQSGLAADRMETGLFRKNAPGARLSSVRSMQLRNSEIAAASSTEKRRFNAWPQLELADPKSAIHIPSFLQDNTLPVPDFIKIDVDGPDFDILQSLADLLDDPNVLGVGAEVIFVGSSEPWEHTFHNTDRFLRSKGFDLFDLTVYRYSNQALPTRYLLPVPGMAEAGRPYYGDALYIRDLAAPHRKAEASIVTSERIAKTAALFSLFGLPDCAAEVLTIFQERLVDLLNIEQCLDELAREVQGNQEAAVGYREWIQLFEADDERFYVRGKHVPAKQDENSVDLVVDSPKEWSAADLRRALRSWWPGRDELVPRTEAVPGRADIIHTLVPGASSIELVAHYPEFRDYYSECEMETKSWMVENVQPDWFCFDVGANIGYYSVLLSRVAPNGHVWAFEPTSTYDMLRENLTHHGCSNVTTVQVALGARAGNLEESIYRIWGSPPERTNYPFSTLDREVARLGVSRLDCVKIDVDGFDLEVLRGATRTLERFNPWLIVELSDKALGTRGQTVQQALEWLDSQGYRSWVVLDDENYVLRRPASI